MSAIHTVILLVAFARLASAKTPIEGSNLTYECTNDNKIIINGTSSYGSIYAEQKLVKVSQSIEKCNVTKQKDSEGWVIFTVQGCNVSSPVYITVMQDQQETQNDMILGGKGVTKYELKCNEVRRGGVNMTETFEINETNALNIEQKHQMEENVSMKVLNEKHTPLNSSSPVVIGSKLYLLISGNTGFSFLVRSCIASDGNHSKHLTNNGTSLDDSVISNFSNVGNHLNEIEASLFAFHFLKTEKILITCAITVCQDDDNSCPFHIQNNSGRRKRSALLQPHTQTLQTSIRVIDSYIDKIDDSFESGVSTGSRSVVVPLVVYVAFGFVRIQL